MIPCIRFVGPGMSVFGDMVYCCLQLNEGRTVQMRLGVMVRKRKRVATSTSLFWQRLLKYRREEMPLFGTFTKIQKNPIKRNAMVDQHFILRGISIGIRSREHFSFLIVKVKEEEIVIMSSIEDGAKKDYGNGGDYRIAYRIPWARSSRNNNESKFSPMPRWLPVLYGWNCNTI